MMTEVIPNPVSSSQDDLSGQQLGDYSLLRRLGQGAMAVVYLAEQKSLQRKVAFKVLRSQLAQDGNYVQRFLNEAKAAASLVHANIIQIYEVGQLDGIHFIAQEFVSGFNVGQLIQEKGSLREKLVVSVMRQVTAALAKAAEHGIVHRDIKPENIMIARSGEVKVADFGLARIVQGNEGNLTKVGITMGTPLYMSPEQIEGRPLDSRSDIYSLGVTSYHMLSGRPPYTGETALAVAVKHLNAPVAPLQTLCAELPAALCGVVHRMLGKLPEERYENPRQLLKQLRELAQGELDVTASVVREGVGAVLDTATSGVQNDTTQQLNILMKKIALSVPRKVHLKWLVIAALLCASLGAIVAAVTRPKSIFSQMKGIPVPVRTSAWAQLYHAKTTDGEDAWKAVWQEFPNNTYTRNLAKQGLVRHYVQTRQFLKALSHLDDLTNLGDAEVSFRAFGLVGKYIVFSLMDETARAKEALVQLEPEMIDRLDPRTRRQLDDVVSRNQAKLNHKAPQAFHRLNGDDRKERRWPRESTR